MSRVVASLLLSSLFIIDAAQAKWMWNPQIGFYNPRYAVKKTAQEQFDYAMDAVKEKDYVRARKLFARVIQFFPDSTQCAEAQFMLGECYFLDGDYYRAYQSYERLMKEYPKSERIKEVIARDFEIGKLLSSGKRRRWVGIYADRWLGINIKSRGKGVECLEGLLKLDAWDPVADDALFEAGKCQYKMKQYEDARDTFDRLLREYPSSEYAAEAQYYKGMTAYAQYEGPEYDPTFATTASRDFRVLKEEFPQAEITPTASKTLSVMETEGARNRYEIVRYYLKNYHYPAAAVYLRWLAKNCPDTPYGQKASRVLVGLAPLEQKTP